MGGALTRKPQTPTIEMVFEYSFPDEILIEILSFVPAKDLIVNCVLVCHKWKDMVNGHAIWKRKCLRENKTIPPWNFAELPLNYYRTIYLHNPFGRNLLKNPCGEDDPPLTHYLVSHGGDGLVIENPPGGADPVPKQVGSQSCFASSYMSCTASQLIHLTSKEQVPEEILDELKPDIVVGQWYAARFDCGCTYELEVHLMDEDQVVLDTFQFTHREEQWTGKAWAEVTHTFHNYPSGVRIIAFHFSGQDTQFWAGNYGSKMTGGYVKFKLT